MGYECLRRRKGGRSFCEMDYFRGMKLPSLCMNFSADIIFRLIKGGRKSCLFSPTWCRRFVRNEGNWFQLFLLSSAMSMVVW